MTSFEALFAKQRPVQPIDTLDAQQVVSIKEQQETTQNGHIKGRTVIEYITRDGALKEETHAYFQCDRCKEKVYAPTADFLCEGCRTKKTMTKYGWYAFGLAIAGILFVALLKYIIAGLILYGIYVANKEKPPVVQR